MIILISDYILHLRKMLYCSIFIICLIIRSAENFPIYSCGKYSCFFRRSDSRFSRNFAGTEELLNITHD